MSEIDGETAEEAVMLARLRADTASGRAREIRKRARLSQSEVAAAVGVTQPTVGAWEAGRMMPHGKAAAAYAALLERLAKIGREEGA